jgi:small GTP-binding protein
MNSNKEIREEVSKIQAELEGALENLSKQFSKKIKAKEQEDIKKEFSEINDLLDRLKTGLIWIALFGKTSVGKSSVTNSLMNEDVSKVAVEHDTTTIPTAYKKEPWNIVDVPGTMGKGLNEARAIEEAKKAHGLIFMIDSEPLEDEIELFNLVHENAPRIPKIVFVNKWDKVEGSNTKKDQDTIRSRISEKMGKFVKSPEDIVYGSAMLLDKKRDEMIRQEIPQLLDRLYESAGTLGAVMNVLDPSERAIKLTDKIDNHIFDYRLKLARRVIRIFSTATVVAGAVPVPFASLVAHPPLLASMVFAICLIMGKKQSKLEAIKITNNVFVTCAKVMGLSFIVGVGIIVADEIASTILIPVAGLGALVGILANIGGVGYLNYKFTATLGEVTVEYIRNNFSWGEEGEKEIIKRCQEQVNNIYLKVNVI